MSTIIGPNFVAVTYLQVLELPVLLPRRAFLINLIDGNKKLKDINGSPPPKKNKKNGGWVGGG